MRERIDRVLAVAMKQQHDTIILGAWGCGVFRNDPVEVAQWFFQCLTEDNRFRSAFRKVVFAVLDRSPELATFSAFQRKFASQFEKP